MSERNGSVAGRAMAGLLGACLVLAGCTQEVVADPVTDPGFVLGQSRAPAVHWPEGKPEDDVEDVDASWVATLREWDLLVNASVVVGDFSDARLNELDQWPVTAAYSGALLIRLAQAVYYQSVGRAQYPGGPTPMIVEEVEHVDGEVLVTVCSASRWYGFRTVPDLEGMWREKGSRTTFALVEQDGTQVVLNREVSDDKCSLKSARVGFFDPAPAYGQAPSGPIFGREGQVIDPEDCAMLGNEVIDTWRASD